MLIWQTCQQYTVYIYIWLSFRLMHPNSKFKHVGRESHILTTNKILTFTAAGDRHFWLVAYFFIQENISPFSQHFTTDVNFPNKELQKLNVQFHDFTNQWEPCRINFIHSLYDTKQTRSTCAHSTEKDGSITTLFWRSTVVMSSTENTWHRKWQNRKKRVGVNSAHGH